MIKNLSTLKLWQKKIVISIYDAGIVLISYFLSFSIRFGELVPDNAPLMTRMRSGVLENLQIPRYRPLKYKQDRQVMK